MKHILSLLCSLVLYTAVGQDTYLHCGKLVDTKNGKVLNEMTVTVSGDKILKVSEGYLTGGEDDLVVNLKNQTVLPGLIDMHVHIEGQSSPKAYLNRFTKNDADVAFQSTVYAERTLMAGFTTVRDLGGRGVNIALRNAINQGIVTGPRIFTAGKSLASTGGHGDPTNGHKKEFMGDPGPKEGVVNSPEEGRKAVRQRYKDGADVIKITATGGVLSLAKSGSNPQFTIEEIKAITETADDYGMLTAAHAHGDLGMQRAIKGGIKTIEHGSFMSEETMELMKQYNVYMVPTISAGKKVVEKAKQPGYFPEIVAKKAIEVGALIQQTFGRAYKKGVPIAFGTDAGVFPHGENAIEFGYMVEAGMPAMEAIKCATVINAELLGLGDQLGRLNAGFTADIIAVNEDPTENVKTLEEVVFVMKEGVIFKQ